MKQRKVIGIHACKEVIKVRPGSIVSVFLKKDAEKNKNLQEIIKLLNSKKIKFQTKPINFFDNISPSHQGVYLEVNSSPEFDNDLISKDEKQIYLMLDGIEDPHNLGAILRTSWLLGAKGLFIKKNRAASLTPTAHKVACGGAEYVPVIEETNLVNIINDFKDKGFWVMVLAKRQKVISFKLNFLRNVY